MYLIHYLILLKHSGFYSTVCPSSIFNHCLLYFDTEPLMILKKKISDMCFPENVLTESIDNLPPEFKSREVFELMESLKNLTVILTMHRPTQYTSTIIGKILQVYGVKERCECLKCKRPAALPVNNFWYVTVMFANNDNLKAEIENLDLCTFFVLNCNNKHEEINARMVSSSGPYISNEWSIVWLSIHKRELGEYLEECLNKYENDSDIIPALWKNQSNLDDLTFVIFNKIDLRINNDIILRVWKNNNEGETESFYRIKDLINFGALVYRVGWKNDHPQNGPYSGEIENKFVELYNPNNK